MNQLTASSVAGLSGAVALTALHQLARAYLPNAPRMDILGKRAINRLRGWGNREPMPQADLEFPTMAADVAVNGLYYAAVTIGGRDRAPALGAVLGICAGLGALALPERIGLGTPPHSDEPANRAMTIALYLTGGLIAGATAQALMRSSTSRTDG